MTGNTADALVHLHNVGCERGDRRLFRGLSLTVRRGGCVRLLGDNGAGKTTCLRGIAGLHSRLEGRVDCHPSRLFLGHRAGISGQLTVAENLIFRAALAGLGKPDPDQIRSALSAVSLGLSADAPVWQLSAGQQRRVSLGLLYLTPGAALWILDEPFTSLDSDGSLQLSARLAEHCEQGGGVLLTSHQPPPELACETVSLTAAGKAA